jgi:hypothetical protein
MKRLEITQKNTKLRTPQERGQSMVLIAIGLIALIAVVGLATDATLIYKTKQDLQRTIDSAALAAAYKLPDQTVASQAAYEFARLHGYDFDPLTNPLQISFPDYTPPRKAVIVKGSINANFAFLRIFGFQTMMVSAQGEGESAPLDIYLVLDLSESMTYDTYTTAPSHGKPNPWPIGFPPCSWTYQSDCVAKYCNWVRPRKCDPLDTSIKPAAKFLVDQLDSRYDRIGVVTYDQQGIKVIGLSDNFTAVKDAIDNLNAFDHQESPSSSCPNTSPAGCNKQTNIGDGIMVAHNNIATEGRLDAIWSLVLLTDGKANVYRSCSNCPSLPPTLPNCGAPACGTLHLCNECLDASNWAIDNAKATWNWHETVIYTIAYGKDNINYQDLMIVIADWTDNGVQDYTTDNFWAPTDMATLKIAFAEIAQRIYGRLIH